MTNTTYSPIFATGINVKNFGATGDGIADDATTIQNAVNAAIAAGSELFFPPGTYRVNTEISVSAAYGLRIRGSGGYPNPSFKGTKIIAGAAIRSCMDLVTSPTTVEGIVFDGGELAQYALYCEQGTLSRFVDCWFTHGKLDGINILYADAPILENCNGHGNGTIYCSSAAVSAQYAVYEAGAVRTNMRQVVSGTTPTLTTATSNSRLLTISGAGVPDLTTLGVRYGDILRLAGGTGGTPDGTALFFQITEVINPTQLMLACYTRVPPTATAYTEWAIGVGDGLRTAGSPSGNNSQTDIRGGLYQYNAGSGAAIIGNYTGVAFSTRIIGGAEMQNNCGAGYVLGVPHTSGDLGTFSGGGAYTFAVANGNANVTASSSMTGILSPGIFVEFSSQPAVKYFLQSVSGTAIVLTAPYTGAGAGAATLTFDTLGAEASGFSGDSIYHEANVGPAAFIGYLFGGRLDNITWGQGQPSSATVLFDANACFLKISPTGFGPALTGPGGSGGESEEFALGSYVTSVPQIGQANYRTGFVLNEDVIGASSFQFSPFLSFHWANVASDYTLTSTPTIATPPNGGSEFLWIYNYSQGSGKITLQDNGVLAGSGLLLKTPTVTIPPGGVIFFNYDNFEAKWVEYFRSGCTDQAYFTNANTTYAVDQNVGLTRRPDDTIFCSGSAFNVTLPDPILYAGRKLKVKATANSAITYTILPHAAEKIDGASSYALTLQFACVELTSDGTDWWVTGSYNGTVI